MSAPDATYEDGKINCSLCDALVNEEDTCAQGTCRACHKTISFEECVAFDRRIDAATDAHDADEIKRAVHDLVKRLHPELGS